MWLLRQTNVRLTLETKDGRRCVGPVLGTWLLGRKNQEILNRQGHSFITAPTYLVSKFTTCS
jgi:hypothetical protein